jgi:hypothetical protein
MISVLICQASSMVSFKLCKRNISKANPPDASLSRDYYLVYEHKTPIEKIYDYSWQMEEVTENASEDTKVCVRPGLFCC